MRIMQGLTRSNAPQTYLPLILGLLAIAATINATDTTPVLVETTSTIIDCTTGMGNPCNGNWLGPQSWFISTRGYHLSKIQISTKEKSSVNEIVGTVLYYDPDIAGSASTIASNNFGEPNLSGSSKTNLDITQRVKKVKMVKEKGQLKFVFTYKDNSTASVGSGSDSDTPSYELAVCGNLIGMRCNFHQGGNSVVDKLGACEIYDDLPVTYYSIFMEIASFTYTLHQGIATKTWESTELGCYNELFTVTYVKDGATISQPGWITFSSVTRTFVVSTTDKANIGTYTVTIRGTLQNLNNSSTGSPYYDEFTFTLTVQSDCDNTTLTNKTINNMTLSVGGSNTQDATFADSTATTRNDANYCGTRTYTFTPSKTFLTIINGSTLQVSSNNVSDVGVYSISMEVKLSDFPSIAGITKTFTVTVTCTVSTLTFSTSPMASKTIEVGIDSQPFTIDYAVTKSPNCAQNPTWSLSPSLAFITKAEDSGNLSGVISINNATLSNVSSNALTLTAQVDSQTAISSFTVIIKDPCSRAVFQNTPAPTHMSVTMPSTATSTQTVTIKTDVQNSYPSIVCPIQAVLTPSSTFISLSADYGTISLNTSNISLPNEIGTKTFTLTIDSLNYASSVADQAYTFNVIVVCTVSSLTISTQPANTNYVLNQGSTTTTALAITQSSACDFAYTYTHAFIKNGVSVNPSWISFASHQFTFTVTDPADIGTYTVTTTSEIPQVDPSTGVNRKITSSFNIVVVSDCTITMITDRSINNMTQSVTAAAQTQDVFFWDAKSGTDKNYCGPRTYTLNPTRSFLSISGDLISVQTNSESDIATHTIQLTVSLTNYPLILSITKSFQITITCGVQQLSFVAPLIPVLTTLQVGIDSQPSSVPFTTTQFPNCGKTVTFSLNPNTYSFISLTTSTISSGSWTIIGATNAQHNTYSFTLTGTVDERTATANFQVFIKDPCSSSVFKTTPNPLTDISIIMYYQTTETKSQAVKILTDVEQANPSIVCPISAVLTPAKPYISVSSDYSSIILDGSKASDADVGLHTFTLTVNSKLFSALVTQVTFTFVVEFKACVVSDFVFSQSIGNITYMISDPQVTTAAFSATQKNLACNFPTTKTQIYKKNGSTIPRPSFLSYDNTTRTFRIQTSSKSDIGVYSIDVKASIPQVLQPSGTKEISFTFVVTVESDCKNSQINDRVVANMQASTNTPATQDLTFTNTRAVFHNDINHCGEYAFVLSPVHSFLSITGTTMTLSTSLRSDQGVYQVSLTVSMKSFPNVPTVTKSFLVKISCEITEYTVIKALPAHSTYTIQIEPFLALSYLVTNKEECPMNFTVEPETRPYNLIVDSQKSQLIFETRDLNHSGIYPLQLKISPAAGEFGVSKLIDFKVEMINICKTTTFDKIKIPSLEILKQAPNFLQDNYIDFGELKTEAEKLGVDCGKVKHQIKTKNQKDALPSWIKVDEANKKHIVNVSREESSNFQQSFNHHTELVDYPQIAFDQPFNVTLSNAGFSCLSNPQSTFITGDPPMQFGIQFSNNTFVKDMVLTQILEPVAFNSNEAEIPLPAFISFDRKTLQFKIQDPTYETMDKYRFGITLGYKEFPQGTVTCTKTVEVKYVTKFEGSVPDKITIACEDKKEFSLTLPEYTDIFRKKAQVDMNIDAVSNFLKFDSNKLSTFVDSSELCTYEGQHKAVIKLTDSAGFTKEINIDVIVTKRKFVIINKKVEAKSTFVPQFKLPPPKPRIKYVDYVGRVRVEFTRPIVLPTFTQYPEFQDPKFLRQNCTNGSEEDCGQKSRSLAATTPQQNLKEALTIVNKGIVHVNKTTYPVIDLHMLPGGLQSDESKLKFQWECVDFKEQWMDFQLNYTFQDDVSIHEQKDLLQVSFIGKQYFKSEDGQMFEESVIMQRKEVPKQINPALGKKMEGLANAVGNSSKAIAIANLLMNFVLGGVLAELLAVMTKLQIMLHLLIINVQIPPQTLIFFKGLLGMVTFQILDLSPYIARMFKLDSSDSSGIVNQNMVYLGYQSTYFVFNMGNILIMLFVNLLVICFIAISKRCQNQKVKIAHDKIRNMFIWNGIYKGINEPYVVYVISCFTQVNSLRWGETGQRANNVIMFLYAIIIVILPVWTFGLLIRNKDNLNKEEFKQKFFSVYEQLKYQKGGAWTLAEPSISMVRMLLTCAALLFMQEYRALQLVTALFLHYIVMIYNGQVNPFKEQMYGFFQNLNEFFVFLTIINLMCFADVVHGEQEAFWFNRMGYVLMVTVCLNLLINFSYIMGNSIKQSCQNFRIKYYLWRRKKLTQAIEIKQALQEQELLIQAKVKRPLFPHNIELKAQFMKDLGMSSDSSIINYSSKSIDSEANLLSVSSQSENLLVNDNKRKLSERNKSHDQTIQIVNQSESAEETKVNKQADKTNQNFQSPNLHNYLDLAMDHNGSAYQDDLKFKHFEDRRQKFKGNDRFNKALRYGSQKDHENFDNLTCQDEMKVDKILGTSLNAFSNTPYWNNIRYQDGWEMDKDEANAYKDGFSKKRSKGRSQSQTDELWGNPDLINDQLWGNHALFNTQKPYVQPSEDRDDESAHSSRVQKRQSDANSLFHSAKQTRLLFDSLWKDNLAQKEDKVQKEDPEQKDERVKRQETLKPKGLISIKKLNGDKNTRIFNDFNENDQSPK